MEPTKLLLLFCLVSFGAYSEYQAGKTVQRLKTKEKKSVVKNVMSYTGERLFKRADLSAQPCPMCLAFIFLSDPEEVRYCISAKEITSFDTKLKVGHIFKELSKVKHERVIPEISIVREEATRSIERYREI